LLRFRQAIANSDDTRVRIDDSAEDREPRFYLRQLLVDFETAAVIVPSSTTGSAARSRSLSCMIRRDSLRCRRPDVVAQRDQRARPAYHRPILPAPGPPIPPRPRIVLIASVPRRLQATQGALEKISAAPGLTQVIASPGSGVQQGRLRALACGEEWQRASLLSPGRGVYSGPTLAEKFVHREPP
jgi:hypothetical protein